MLTPKSTTRSTSAGVTSSRASNSETAVFVSALPRSSRVSRKLQPLLSFSIQPRIAEIFEGKPRSPITGTIESFSTIAFSVNFSITRGSIEGSLTLIVSRKNGRSPQAVRSFRLTVLIASSKPASELLRLLRRLLGRTSIIGVTDSRTSEATYRSDQSSPFFSRKTGT